MTTIIERETNRIISESLKTWELEKTPDGALPFRKCPRGILGDPSCACREEIVKRLHLELGTTFAQIGQTLGLCSKDVSKIFHHSKAISWQNEFKKLEEKKKEIDALLETLCEKYSKGSPKKVTPNMVLNLKGHKGYFVALAACRVEFIRRLMKHPFNFMNRQVLSKLFVKGLNTHNIFYEWNGNKVMGLWKKGFRGQRRADPKTYAKKLRKKKSNSHLAMNSNLIYF